MGFRKLSARPRHHAQDEEAAAAFEDFLALGGGDRREGGSWQADRDSVSRRSSDRAEKRRSPADRRNPGHGLRRRTTRGRVQPIFSAPSAPAPKEKAPGSYYPPATASHGPASRRNLRLRSHQARMPLVLLDQAGWRVSAKLPVPDNITLLPLPPKSPELNPVENIWQFHARRTGSRTAS